MSKNIKVTEIKEGDVKEALDDDFYSQDFRNSDVTKFAHKFKILRKFNKFYLTIKD